MWDNKRGQIGEAKNQRFSLAPIFLNKRGQIGETMTWVIATLVIVVILSISIFATSFASKTTKKIIYLNDKEKDFIATKSITSFLRNETNVELLENEDPKGFEEKLKSFLKILPGSTTGGQGGWNFERDYSGGTEEVLTYSLIPNVFGQYDYFEIKMLTKLIKLRFWEECQGKCR